MQWGQQCIISPHPLTYYKYVVYQLYYNGLMMIYPYRDDIAPNINNGEGHKVTSTVINSTSSNSF